MDKIKILNKEYKLLEPTGYEIMKVTSWIENEETPEKFKTNSTTGFYLIYSSLEDDNGNELSDEIDFKTFLKSVKIPMLRRLEKSINKFQTVGETESTEENDSIN